MSTAEMKETKESQSLSNPHNITHAEHHNQVEEPKVTLKAICLGLLASMGGMVFGYESGQISGKISPIPVHNLLVRGACVKNNITAKHCPLRITWLFDVLTCYGF